MRRVIKQKMEDGSLQVISQNISVPLAEWQELKRKVEEGTGFNDEIWVTESGEFEVPYTTDYEILAIDGGDGGEANSGNNYVIGGKSGNYKYAFVHFEAGQHVPIIIGSGGIGHDGPHVDSVQGGITTVGDVDFSAYVGNRFQSNFLTYFQTSRIYSAGSGFGGGNVDGVFWWGAGGTAFIKEGMTDTNHADTVVVGDGKQGAVRFRFHNPTKA